MSWFRKNKETKTEEGNNWKNIGDNIDVNPENYAPDAHRKWLDKSGRLPIFIDNEMFWTYMDIDNVQRFKENTAIKTLFEKAKQDMVKDGKPAENNIFADFEAGKFTTRDWLYFLTSTGYSVAGLRDLPEFAHLHFENPLWK